MKVTTIDGLALDVFSTEIKFPRTILFINALGISSQASAALSKAFFAKEFNFVTWDRRGLPGAYDDNFRKYSMQDQVNDALAIIQSLKLQEVIVMAWCSGIHTALALAKDGRAAIRSMILFNSPNYFGTRYSGVPGDAIGQVSRILVQDEKKLDFLYETIFAKNTPEVDAKATRIEDKAMQQLMQAPFKSGKEALLRYAYLITNSSELSLTPEWCAAIHQPIYVVGAKEDHMVSFEDSITLAGLLPNATLEIMDSWGHYDLFIRVDAVTEQVSENFLH